mmetsp:Transcript_26437/g.53884  ORF Transcript_26437/g.53884 Transcript_26437/m.53884 type:complete len:80 (-) Transcript_26437:254-493(-)
MRLLCKLGAMLQNQLVSDPFKLVIKASSFDSNCSHIPKKPLNPDKEISRKRPLRSRRCAVEHRQASGFDEMETIPRCIN